jgi:hypothetical protein
MSVTSAPAPPPHPLLGGAPALWSSTRVELLNGPPVSETLLRRQRLAVKYSNGVDLHYVTALLRLCENELQQPGTRLCVLRRGTTGGTIFVSMIRDGTALSEGVELRGGRLIGGSKELWPPDVRALQAQPPEQQQQQLATFISRLSSSVEEYLLQDLSGLFFLPCAKFAERGGGGAEKVVARDLHVLAEVERCQRCLDHGAVCSVPCCAACVDRQALCAACIAAGQLHWHQDGRACIGCATAGHDCLRLKVQLFVSDQFPENQAAAATLVERFPQRQPLFGKHHVLKTLRGARCFVPVFQLPSTATPSVHAHACASALLLLALMLCFGCACA